MKREREREKRKICKREIGRDKMKIKGEKEIKEKK